jgi:hypothetical protein
MAGEKKMELLFVSRQVSRQVGAPINSVCVTRVFRHIFILGLDLLKWTPTPLLHLQTPNDGGLFFSCHMALCGKNLFASMCILISSEPIIEIHPEIYRKSLPKHLGNRLLELPGYIPTRVGHFHVEATIQRELSLVQCLEDIETVISNGVETDFDGLARSLHQCNLELIKLRGRRKFEKQLLDCVSSFTSALSQHVMKKMKANMLYMSLFEDFFDIRDEPNYDLDELTTRITNAFTAVSHRNLINKN